MKKIFFVIICLVAVITMAAVATDPLESNNLDPENNVARLLIAIIGVASATLAPVFGYKARVALYAVAGIATIFGGWQVTLLYAVFAAYMWRYISGDADIEKMIKDIFTEEKPR